MPLQKDPLKKKFVAAFAKIKKMKDVGGPPPPLMAKKIAEELAKAYDEWVKESSPLAGGLTISVPGQASVIAAALILTPLMAGWTPGLTLYWTAVIWGNNPGFIPANPTIPAALAGVAAELLVLVTPPPKVKSEEEFADKLATILSTYTTQLQVTATTVAGAASTVPVT